jgi:hypothetical protein
MITGGSNMMMRDALFCAETARLYQTGMYSMQAIAAKLGVSFWTVQNILQLNLKREELQDLKAKNYSRGAYTREHQRRKQKGPATS